MGQTAWSRLWSGLAGLFGARQAPEDSVDDVLDRLDVDWADRRNRMLRTEGGRGLALVSVGPEWPWKLRFESVERLVCRAKVRRTRRRPDPGGGLRRDRGGWHVPAADREIVVEGTDEGLALFVARGAERQLRRALITEGDWVGATFLECDLSKQLDTHAMEPATATGRLNDRIHGFLRLVDALAPADDALGEIAAATPGREVGPLAPVFGRALHRLDPTGASAPAFVAALRAAPDLQRIELGCAFDRAGSRDVLLQELERGIADRVRRRSVERALVRLPRSSSSWDEIRRLLERDTGHDRLELAVDVLLRPDVWPAGPALAALPGAVRGTKKTRSRPLLDGLLSGLGRKEVLAVADALLPHLGALPKAIADRVCRRLLDDPTPARRDAVGRAAAASVVRAAGPLRDATVAYVVQRLGPHEDLDACLQANLSLAHDEVVAAAVARAPQVPALVPALTAVVPSRGRAVTTEYLTVLRRMRPDDARPALHHLLGLHDGAWQLTVADALVVAGDRTSVPVLRAAADEAPRRQRRELEACIDRIQANLGPSAIGALAVVSDGGGELSMVEGGGLALDE